MSTSDTSQELVTIDSITGFLRGKIETKDPISPSLWLDAAQKINVLLQDLDEAVVEAEIAKNVLQSTYMEDGDSAAKSKVKTEASEPYRAYLLLKAKRERAIEFIRIAKKRVEVQHWDQ